MISKPFWQLSIRSFSCDSPFHSTFFLNSETEVAFGTSREDNIKHETDPILTPTTANEERGKHALFVNFLNGFSL